METSIGRDADTATAVLEFARARRADADEAERDVLMAAAEWASFHHADGLPERPSATVMHADGEVDLAGEGAPGMREFAIAEFAAALGMSTDTGRRLLGDALELRHRLPAVWSRITSGTAAAWKARMVAQRTKQWSPEVAAHVDARVAPLTHKIGPIQLGRLVEEAIAVVDVDNAVEESAVEPYVRITPNGPTGGLTGTASVEALLDLADALALERAVAATAHALIDAESPRSLGERRALALGHLADAACALTSHPGSSHPDLHHPDLHHADRCHADRCHASPDDPHPNHQHPSHPDPRQSHPGCSRSGRHLQLYVHLGEPQLAEAHLARVERLGLVTEETVASWCLTSRVTVTPVLDLNSEQTHSGYTPSRAVREQVALIDQTCAFPWCSRSARSADLDHIEPYDGRADSTSTSNLAALCRRHHRLKTHSGWSYQRIGPGSYDWRSPRGDRYRRDREGSRVLNQPQHDQSSGPKYLHEYLHEIPAPEHN